MVILLASSLLAITVQVHNQCAVAGLFSLPGLCNSFQCLFFPQHIVPGMEFFLMDQKALPMLRFWSFLITGSLKQEDGWPSLITFVVPPRNRQRAGGVHSFF